MEEDRLRILLVSPQPPPYGGISHWTRMICNYAVDRENVEIVVLDTATRWRKIHENQLWRRAFGGFAQFVRDFIRLGFMLAAQRFNAIHLTTPGHLAVVRDIGVVCLAKVFRVPVFYHIRFGRVPEIAKRCSLEWRLISWVMNRAKSVIAIDGATGAAIRSRLPNARLQTIPNCVNFSELPGSGVAETGERTALFLGWVVAT